MASIFHMLKAPEGRLSQQGYIFSFALPFIAVTVASSASLTGMMGAAGSLVMQVCALGCTVLLAFGDAMNIRRYHDLGHSGRLYRLCRPGIVILPVLAFVLQFLIPAQMATAGDLGALAYLMNQEVAPSMGLAPSVLLAITFAGVTLNLAYLSLMPGQAGPNAYGPDPNNGIAAMPGVIPTPRSDVASDNDPVKRALAEYEKQRAAQAQQATRPATPSARAGASGATGAFGKKRS
ncbi:MAG: DUF805 domain-containing protein [Hyphomonadaceae bacterium]